MKNTKIAVVDVETTTFEKGNPFSTENKLVCVGIWMDDVYHEWKIEYESEPYGAALKEIREILHLADLVVGFNLKFDIHWLRNYIPDLRLDRIWDVQLFEFIKHNQNDAFPSLDDVALRNNLPPKLDVVKTHFWDKGINTDKVPWNILSAYMKYDIILTKDLYELQEQFLIENPQKKNLFFLHCYDLLTLQEIEFNGLLYDRETSLQLGSETTKRRDALTKSLNDSLNLRDFNWNSDDHISALLYGGHINYETMEMVTRQYTNHERTYERKCIRWHELPALVEPPKGSETKPTNTLSDSEMARINEERKGKGQAPFYRIYSVDENTLKSLLKHKQIRSLIRSILELGKLKKLSGTYYLGIPKIMDKMKWLKDIIHGTINQCRVITGRTSSSKPNLQNFDSELKYLFYSRF